MKIALFTNTFLPHVGGVARSVQTILEDYRRERHRVLVVAPEFADGSAPNRIERSVERVAALQNFNGSDFSVRLPLATALSTRLASFQADVIHAHHPFLLGDTALRIAAHRGLPVVFTHHTLYEQYTHYVPFNSPSLQQFVIDLCTRFANCCQGVIAPSASIAELLTARGVTAPIRIVPTGIDTRAFARGDRRTVRSRLGLGADEVLFGHVGRLAPEKNLEYLAEAVALSLKRLPRARFLVVGDGPSRARMQEVFYRNGVAERVHFAGKLAGRRLHDAYAAMDLFVFSSQSETQGMVLAEAMAAGNPVIALDASGVREVVRDRRNGRLLPARATGETFARALVAAARAPATRSRWRKEALRTARSLDRQITARQALDFYTEVIATHRAAVPTTDRESAWNQFRERVAIEGRLLADKCGAAVRALTGEPAPTLAAG